ncbi:MAG TPA: SOS response-associated peptidase [Sandaracinaceae bacterium LLY-WYZ-13_1]|nr:SOS response-associated peptidase [Sandaracinaceae bacterium LLY-WYZ-13_1]
MCARYTMATPPDELIEEFEATLAAERLEPHYNIAPTQDAPIVIAAKETGERRLGLARFGLVPHWAKDTELGPRLLNARVETAADKPAFRDAFARHRCLVVADGFYEWRREGKVKVPYWFRLPDGRPFGLAGLWAVWHDPEGNRVSSFTILTRDAHGPVAEIHDRMPVVLPRAAYGPWLDRETRDPEAIAGLLGRERGDDLERIRVSRRVNDVRNDDPSLVEPVEA